MDKQITKGLAEVSRMLAEYKKTTPKQKKKFLKYADAFERLSKLNKTIKLNKEDKMVKLTEKQKEEREFMRKVKKAMTDVKKLSKKHGLDVLKRASFLYWRSLHDKARALEQIRESEEEVAKLKKQYRI